MARLKRTSAGLEQAIQRCAGMRSIDGFMRFGNDLSLTEYNDRIVLLQAQLSQYNSTLSALDGMAESITSLERELRTYSEKMLMSVATRYGKESLEYMQAGGTPRKRKHRVKNEVSAEVAIAAPTGEKAATNGKGTKVA
jgi:hypothetical protein